MVPKWSSLAEVLSRARPFATNWRHWGPKRSSSPRTSHRLVRWSCSWAARSLDLGGWIMHLTMRRRSTSESSSPLRTFLRRSSTKHIASNLKSVWLCMKHEISQMLHQGGGGAIVNTSSVNGLGGVPQNALYAASIAGVLGLTKSAAQEYAKQGIRINALVAGGFDTPMLNGVFARVSPEDPLAAKTGFAQLVPLGRIGRPEEAADAVLWLCSSASSYVTGHSLIVDGGMTAPFR